MHIMIEHIVQQQYFNFCMNNCEFSIHFIVSEFKMRAWFKGDLYKICVPGADLCRCRVFIYCVRCSWLSGTFAG